MKISQVCKEYNLDLKVAQILEKHGYLELYPPQETTLSSGILSGKNFVLSMPTASGKTLIAELCMLKSILSNNGKCLYVVPLRALANEKYENLKEKYTSLGVKVGIATGDYNMPSNRLASYDIIVATSEKVDSILRFRARWLFERLTVGIFDEIHLLDDNSRGPTLEVLITRLKQLNPKMQLVGLSATIKNAHQIAKWLNGDCFLSSWRPVPLREGVYFNEIIQFEDGKHKKVKQSSSDTLSSLCLDTINDSGQVLVFVNTRRSTQAQARKISQNIFSILSDGDKKKLLIISNKITGSLSEPTKINKELSECVKKGAAFHHAGLASTQRKLIEDNFKNNTIKVICATPTLAAGVNLPARRVIIRDYTRYEVGLGSYHIAVFEYKQMRGRAGRPKYDKFGEAIMIAKSSDEQECLLKEFIESEPEPIISKLGQENALRTHILSSIASGYTYTKNGLRNFLHHTFFAQQENPDELDYIIERIIDFLSSEEMITVSGSNYKSTPFGNLVSHLYIDPLSGVTLKKGLINAGKMHTSIIALLHLVCICPDMGNLRLTKKSQEEVELFFALNNEKFLLPFNNYFVRSDYKVYLQTVKTAMMLHNWIEEFKEDEICEKFSVGPGDIRRHLENAKWLLYAAGELSKLFKIKTIIPKLEKLNIRTQYGVKEELLNLVSLKDIGRIRARSLFNNGIKNLRDIEKIDIKRLKNIDHIGKALAESIKLGSGLHI